MKIKQRALTLLLSLAVMFTFMPAMAFAEGSEGDTGSEVTSISYQLSDEREAITVYEYQVSEGYAYDPCQGDKLIVETSDGEAESTTEYTYDGDKAFISEDGDTISSSDVQFNLVSDEGTYKIEVEYEGNSAQISVEVLEDPAEDSVDSIAFTPFEQKVVYDYYLEDECEQEDGYYLYYPELVEGDSIEITYKDETTATYKLTEGDDEAVWVNENDSDDVISMDDFCISSARIPVSAADGDSATFEIEYSNVTTTGTVVFKKSNISSITYTPKSTAITLYEGVDEINETDDNGNVVTYFDVKNAYDYLYGFWNDEVTIEYNGGTSETLALDELNWDYVTVENGEYVSLDEAQQVTPWGVGNTYEIFLKAKGKIDTTHKITVEIETNPYNNATCTFTQTSKYLYVFETKELEYDSGDDEYILEDSNNRDYAGSDGDILSFTLADGSTVEFKYGRIENDPDYPDGWDGFFTTDANGNKSRLQRRIMIKDTELHWTKDSEGRYINDNATLTYMGVDSNEKMVSYAGYEVWFDANGGEGAANVAVPLGMSVNEQPDENIVFQPERSGYKLIGWYEMDENTGELKEEPYDFDTKIYKETFLYAKWEECDDDDDEGIDWDLECLDNDYYLDENDSVELSPVVSYYGDDADDPSYEYQWSKYNTSTEEYDDIEEAKSEKYTAAAVGTYRCTVTITVGDESEEKCVDFNVYSWRITSSGDRISVEYGKEVTLTIETNYSGADTMTYQWYKYDEDEGEDGDYVAISGATASSYKLEVTDYYYIMCEATADGQTQNAFYYVCIDTDDYEYEVTYSEATATFTPASEEDELYYKYSSGGCVQNIFEDGAVILITVNNGEDEETSSSDSGETLYAKIMGSLAGAEDLETNGEEGEAYTYDEDEEAFFSDSGEMLYTWIIEPLVGAEKLEIDVCTKEEVNHTDKTITRKYDTTTYVDLDEPVTSEVKSITFDPSTIEINAEDIEVTEGDETYYDFSRRGGTDSEGCYTCFVKGDKLTVTTVDESTEEESTTEYTYNDDPDVECFTDEDGNEIYPYLEYNNDELRLGENEDAVSLIYQGVSTKITVVINAEECDHDLEEVAEVPASCTTEGTEAYWVCKNCGKLFSDAEGTTEIEEPVAIDKKAHTSGEAVHENEVAATCKADGSYEAVVYCTVCSAEISRETVTVPATGHSYQEEVTAPTCTEGGYTTYTCSVCGDTYTGNEIDALGHDWGSVTYTWADNNSTVTATHTCSRDSSHIETETVSSKSEVTKAATCAEAGETTYTATFTNAAFKDQTKTEEIEIDPDAHTIVAVAKKDATCEEEGYEAHYKCSGCGKLFSDAEGTTEIEEPTTIAALGHTLTAHVAVEATCSKAGNSEYWSCSECGKYFSDAEGTKEIAANSWVVPATGNHTWKAGANAYTYYADYYNTTRTDTCSVCGAKRTVNLGNTAYKVSLPKVKVAKGAAGKKKMTAKWKKVSAKNKKKISGIEIQVSGPGIDNKIYTAGKGKTSKVIKGLKSKKKYKYRVRSYKGSGTSKQVSKWSGWKTVKVK